MKVDITIEFDKELATTIKATVQEIFEGIKNRQGIFDKPDLSATTESVSEPKPKQTKQVKKRKPSAQKTLRGTVMKVIKQNEDGISRKALQDETGFTGGQISNIVYQLKKNQKIQMTEDGLLKIL